jgi:hypothetical protein
MAFDPEFDDTRWTWDWLNVPFVQIPPGRYASGYIVRREWLETAIICDCPVRLPCPLDCRGLYDPSGLLWMSDTPQERLMMHNNARASGEHVLIGGLGLGLYPQYVAPRARSLTIVERSPDIVAIVWPVIKEALAEGMGGVRPQIVIADVEAFLRRAPAARYDTIFLDTWEELNATRLPQVNRLRDLAMRHLAPGGRVLLWGYRWMVRLFETACVELLRQPADQRAAWLAERADNQPAAAALLTPAADHFADQTVDDLNDALAWCRRYVVSA